MSNQKRIGLEGTIKAYAGCSRIIADRMGVVADSSRNPLSTRSMWRATGADGAGFARRYWLSPNSANAWPLQGRIDIVAF